MSYLTEKASYLKGLLEGAELDTTTKEGKLLKAVIELLGEMTDEIEGITDELDELEEQVDEVDQALADVEDEIYGECGCEDEDGEDDDDWDFDDDDELAVECPHCGDTIYLDASLLENCENSITCPNCKEEIEIEFTDECDCGHHHDEE